MKKPNIHSLSILDFLKLEPKRNEKIDAASPEESIPLEIYKANRLASELHPTLQYLKVSEIIPYSADTKSFRLVPDTAYNSSLAYPQAGQYISVNVQIGDLTFSRPYSLSSSPKEAMNGAYMITVRRVPNGTVSNFILDNWTVGTCVTASAPEGQFTYEPLRDAKTVIGIAGGSGITPFRALAKAIADGDEDADLTLLYGTRTKADALFLDEFRALENTCPRIRLVNVFSDSSDKTGLGENEEFGFISAELIMKYAPEDQDYSVFACGPQAMYDFLSKEIPKLQIRKKYIRFEVFGEPHFPERNADYPGTDLLDFNLTVKIGTETKTVPCHAGETLLVSMEKAGISAPSRCRSGECGFCHSKLVSGKVYTPKANDGRRLADEDYGYIHPCSSFPLSDIELDVPIGDRH